jgi:polyprenyl-phospho-N-acetylgalactosaminyl synthase
MEIKTAIVIPVYNESKIINSILSNPDFNKYTVVIVDDGSKEQLELDKMNFPLYLLKHSKNLGQGAALQTGMEFCKSLGANVVVHFDGDGQHQVDDIQNLIEPIIKNRANITIGSRFMERQSGSSNSTIIPYHKLIILKLAKVVQFLFTGIVLSDSQNGLRALSENALNKITIKENRMAHAIEIIQSCVRNKIKIEEVPVNILYSKYSLDKGQKLYNGLLICVKLFLNKIKLMLAIVCCISFLVVIIEQKGLISTKYFYYTMVFIFIFTAIFLLYNYKKRAIQNETSKIRKLAIKNVREI